MSQKEKILQYMIAIPGRRINTWTAYAEFHITTLAQRIQDLRQELKWKPLILSGREYFIDDELVTRDGATFSEYWLEPVKIEELQGVLF